MTWPTIFANLAGGNQPLALFDAMFNQVAAMIQIPSTASGSNLITLTPIGNAPTLAAYSDFNLFSFRAAATSSGAVTLNFGGLATLSCYKRDGVTPVGSGDLVSGRPYVAMYHSSLSAGAGGFYLEESTLPTSSPTTNVQVFEAGGRVTLVTGTPVMTANAAGIGQHYYTPDKHRFVPIYDGVNMIMTDVGGELTQLTTDATKSPAAVAASSVYFLWVWNDGGVYRCTRGTAWTNDTTPGANNALTLQNGVPLNTNAITNGPSALRGTLVGAVRSNGSSLLDWILGGAGANGTAAFLWVSNVYNQVPVEVFVQDTTDSWTYTTATWRSANNSTSMRVSFLQALARAGFSASYHAYSSNGSASAAVPRACGIGYDSTSALATGCSPGRAELPQTAIGFSGTTANLINPKQEMHAEFSKMGDSGAHFCQAVERSTASSTTTWFGDNAADTYTQNGLFFRGMF